MESERINCELFHIRTGLDRVTIDRGLSVVEHDGKRFIDPQEEPGYTTTLGPAKAEHLTFQFSDELPPEVEENKEIVKNISLSKAVLGVENQNYSRFRAFEPVAEPLGKYALVSVVDHDPRPMDMSPYRVSKYASAAGTKLIEAFNVDNIWEDPWVGVSLLKEGDSLYISCDFGQYFSERVDFSITYDPDSDQGLKSLRLPISSLRTHANN